MTMERKEIRVGFPADSRKIVVEVPEGDAPPWDLSTRHSIVGTGVDRVDAVAKVTGRACYAYDQHPDGMLFAAMLRSPHAKARVRRIDVSKALEMPGVAAAIATKEPGGRTRIRFAGDDVAAVAAETYDQARDALEHIRVEYEVFKPVVEIDKAVGAPKSDADGNVIEPWPRPTEGRRREQGEAIERALAEAAHVVERTYRTEVQTHSCLETHGVVAWYRKGKLEVWASTQATFGVQANLARALGLDPDDVRVHAEFVGGGFGSKFGAGAEGVAAARLSKLTGRPVKLMLDRHEEHVAAGNRPSSIIQIRAGTDAEGRIVAWDYRSWGGPGYTGRGGATRDAYYYLAENPAEVSGLRAYRKTMRDLVTDTDAARAMRAPGWPQGVFASESMIDELAEACGMDPLEFRLRNDKQRIRREEWRLGAERFEWSRRRNPRPGHPRPGDDPRFLRGAGMAGAVWHQMGGAGRRNRPYRIACEITREGRVIVRSGAQDIGTGMKTVMATVAAEELEVEVARVTALMGDTRDPFGPASGGSTTTPSLAPAVRHAAWLAKRELCARFAARHGVDAADVHCEAGRLVAPSAPAWTFEKACAELLADGPIRVQGRRFPNYDGYAPYVCGAQFAEVEVDRRTGNVRVTYLLGLQDTGLTIAKKLAESQVLGGMIQGISYALYEQRILDRETGRMLNPNFQFYKIAGPTDVPPMEAIVISVANGMNNVGAAGIGEPPVIATAGAIANAIANATGARVRSLPITPDKVLAALAKNGG